MTTPKKNKKLPISVFIITYNEADRIEEAIKSVNSWVDEIIIVDSGSTDDTINLAKKAGATQVVYNDWPGYGPQKNYAQTLCNNKWLLNLDADERVTESLQREICKLFESKDINKKAAYSIAIKFAPRFQKFSEISKSPEEYVTRLYNLDYASFKMSKVHDSVVINKGKLGKLKHKIKHDCFRDFTHAVNKINHYTSMQADDLYSKGRNPSITRIITEPLWTFFRSLFYEKYYHLGLEGILMSIIYAFSRTLRLVKAKEKFLQNK